MVAGAGVGAVAAGVGAAGSEAAGGTGLVAAGPGPAGGAGTAEWVLLASHDAFAVRAGTSILAVGTHLAETAVAAAVDPSVGMRADAASILRGLTAVETIDLWEVDDDEASGGESVVGGLVDDAVEASIVEMSRADGESAASLIDAGKQQRTSGLLNLQVCSYYAGLKLGTFQTEQCRRSLRLARKLKRRTVPESPLRTVLVRTAA